MTATLEPLERIVSGGHGHDGEHGHDHGPKKLPEAAEKYFAKRKLVDKLVNTTGSIHTKVYQTMEETLLQDEDGRVDYDRLKNDETKKKAEDMLIEGYKSQAKRLGATIKKGLSEDEVDIVLNKYFGITKDIIKARLKTGHKYTSAAHEENRDEHLKRVRAEMNPVVAGHFSKDDIESVIEYIGAEGMIDESAVKKNPFVMADLLELNRLNKGKGVPYDKLATNEKLVGYLNQDYIERDAPTSNKEVEKQKKEHEKHAHTHSGHAPVN